MPKYQIPTLDFEAVAAMDDDARTAALDAYRAEVAALGDALAADEQSDADRQSALAAARYDAAKYKLASDKSCAGFADAMDEIETVLADTPALAAMPDEERLRTAYYIVRGKRPAPAPAPEPSAEELFAALEKNPKAMRLGCWSCSARTAHPRSLPPPEAPLLPPPSAKSRRPLTRRPVSPAPPSASDHTNISKNERKQPKWHRF